MLSWATSSDAAWADLDEELVAHGPGRLGRAARCQRLLVLFRSACPRTGRDPFPGIRLSGDYCVSVAAGCPLDQVVAVAADHEGLAADLAMTWAHAGCGRPVRLRSASVRTWCTEMLSGSLAELASALQQPGDQLPVGVERAGALAVGEDRVFCRLKRMPPNQATSGCLPSRSTAGLEARRGPCGVTILALCRAAILVTDERCLQGRVGCTARSRIPCGCGPFLCSLPPNPACTFQRTGLSSDLCRARDRVCVDPVISCRARGERQVPLRLLHCASLMVPSSFIACAPSPCGPSLAVSRLDGRYPAD